MDNNMAEKFSMQLMSISEAVYLTTIDQSGYPYTRAMLNLRNSKQYPGLVKFINDYGNDFTIFFTTNTSSLKVNQIQDEPRVSAYFCKPEEWRGLMLGGKIEVINDKEIKNALWQENWTMYYPGGVGDPDYVVLRLQPNLVKGYHQLNQFTLLDARD